MAKRASLVSYDLSSDEADCSGNEEDESMSVDNVEPEIASDDAIVSSLVDEVVDVVSGGELAPMNWTNDPKGNVGMRWRSPRNATNGATASVKPKVRRKRRRCEVVDEKSSTDWSEADSWTSDSSSSSSSIDTDRDNRSSKNLSIEKQQQPDHEFSEDSDYIYARVVLECRNQSQRRKPGFGKPPPKTRGELDVDDLPPIENLHISIPQQASLRRIGVVSSVVGKLAVIQSDYGVPPLDEETWVVDENKKPIGQIFEIFGPVPRPLYSVRFNAVDEAKERVAVGSKVFFVSDNESLTRTVFADGLRKMKGSDASWEDNNEPPADAVDFSDDEQERQWKAQRRAKSANSSQGLDPRVESGGEATSGRHPKARPARRARRRGGNYNSSDMVPGPREASSSIVVRYPIARNPWTSFDGSGPRSWFPTYHQPQQESIHHLAPPRGQQPSTVPHFRVPLPPPFPVQAVPQRQPFGGRTFQWEPRMQSPRFSGPMSFVDKRYVQNND